MSKAKIVNCKRLGIRRDPCCTRHMEEILITVPAGETLDVDTSNIYYSWNDKSFYKVTYGSYTGYALVDCLELVKEARNRGKHSTLD